jgi:hypothetical protein
MNRMKHNMVFIYKQDPSYTIWLPWTIQWNIADNVSSLVEVGVVSDLG